MKDQVSFFITLLSIIVVLTSCSSANSNKTPTLNPKLEEVIWAKTTNYKLDFNDESGQIEVIKNLGKDLTQIILDEVESGKLKAHHYYNDNELNRDEIQNIFFKADSVYITDPVTYEEKLEIVKNDLDRSKVNKFRVKQQWWYNEKNHQLESKIVSIAPLLAKYSDDNTYRGDLPLFKINY